jgi:hypothetical protein
MLTASLLMQMACSGVREAARSVSELPAVQQAVAQKAPGTIVGIKLTNGAYLNVNLVNSPLKKLPDAERQAKAAELAKIAYDSYAYRSQIKSVRVVFAVVSTTLIVVTTNDSSDAFTFDAAELAGNQSR